VSLEDSCPILPSLLLALKICNIGFGSATHSCVETSHKSYSMPSPTAAPTSTALNPQPSSTSACSSRAQGSSCTSI